jgi:hypothetical protein
MEAMSLIETDPFTVLTRGEAGSRESTYEQNMNLLLNSHRTLVGITEKGGILIGCGT